MRYLLICLMSLLALAMITAQSNRIVTISMEVLGISSIDYRSASDNYISLAVINDEYGFHIIDIQNDDGARYVDATVKEGQIIEFILKPRLSIFKNNKIENKVWVIDFDDIIKVDDLPLKKIN